MKYLCCLIILIISINLSHGQSQCKSESCELKHGVQFQITDLLNISNFRGYTFAYRYLLDDTHGLRFGFKVNYSDQNDDRIVIIDNIEHDAPYEASDLDIKFSAQYLTSILKYNKFSFILGGGPFISFFDNSSETVYPRDDYTQEGFRKENGLSYGVDLIAGVEYSLAKNVIISGESGIYLAMFNADYERVDNTIFEDETLNQINEVKSDRDRIRIGDLSVNLGISIFF